MSKKAEKIKDKNKDIKAKKAAERADELTEKMSKDFKKLMKKLKKKGLDARDDATTLSAFKLMTETTLDMLPTAAKTYYKYPGQGTAYSYSNLVQLVLQLMEQIRGISDLQTQVEHIQQNVINMGLKLIVANLSEEMYELRRWAKLEFDKGTYNKLDRKLDSMLRSQGSFIKEAVAKMQAELQEYLIE